MASRKHDEALYSSNQRDRAGLVGVLLSRFAQIDATEQFLRGGRVDGIYVKLRLALFMV